MNSMAFWSRVKNRIKERALTQKEVAKAIGVDYSKFRNWISRNMVIPTNYAYRLSKYFGVSLEYLITGHGKDIVSKTNEKVLLLIREAEKKLTEIRYNIYCEK